ncbi:MAG: bifunctional pyr operon transcriptional regulator/uracil phosphoribosyltransferase PyrR [Bacteroidetes bacterium]|nr:bifunctional pyr operon transcriptional regulator/uracil phosphoribosyltransferase PyrR [Bacteroidota bacterium]
MQKRLLLNSKHFEITISRLCYQLIENHNDFSQSALIGLQPRGVFVARRIHRRLSEILNSEKILIGDLDITFHRDDYRRRDIILPSETKLNFSVDDRKVILIDDVLYTGRTIRAGMDALLDFVRAKKIELLTLVDRRYSRHLPIEPDYIGIQVDTILSEKVKVYWKETDGEDAAWLITEK